MTATPVRIIAAQAIPAANTTLYTAPSKTQIVNLTLTNNGGAVATAMLYLVPSGGTPGGTNLISTKPMNVNETWQAPEWIGKILEVGDMIQAIASTAGSIVISGSGVQYT